LKLNSTLHDTGTLSKTYLHGPPIIYNIYLYYLQIASRLNRHVYVVL